MAASHHTIAERSAAGRLRDKQVETHDSRRTDRRGTGPGRHRRAGLRLRRPPRRRHRPAGAARRAGRRRRGDRAQRHPDRRRGGRRRARGSRWSPGPASGLDNVDVPAATARGVMVVNAPTSNIVSAAEQAIALLLAVARQHRQRQRRAQGGRVEALEVHRRRGAGQDRRRGRAGPHRRAVRAADGRVRHPADRVRPVHPAGPGGAARAYAWSGWTSCCGRATSSRSTCRKTPETVGLIGEKELATVKPGVRIINAARGGLIDEQALADALRRGPGRRRRHRRLRQGAVHRRRRCSRFDNVVATPHLGASTAEAQDKAGLAVARSVKLALQGEFVPDAVNVQAGGVVDEDVRPLLPLAEKLGKVFTAVAGGVAASVTVEVRGEIVVARRGGAQAGRHQGPVRLGGRGAGHLRQRAAARGRPRRRGRAGRRPTRSSDHHNLVTVRGALPDGRTVSVAGTVTGHRHPRGPQADRGRRLRPGARRRAACCCSSATRTGPAWSARSARSSARPASTSRPCRWPGARPAARR